MFQVADLVLSPRALGNSWWWYGLGRIWGHRARGMREEGWMFQPRRYLCPGQERSSGIQEEWEKAQGNQLDLVFKE